MATGHVGEFPVGSLVRIRERDWVVLPSDDTDIHGHLAPLSFFGKHIIRAKPEKQKQSRNTKRPESRSPRECLRDRASLQSGFNLSCSLLRGSRQSSVKRSNALHCFGSHLVTVVRHPA